MTECCEHRCHLEPFEPKKPFPVKSAMSLLFVAVLVAGAVFWIDQKNTHDEHIAAIQSGHFQPPLTKDAGLGILLAGTGAGVAFLGLFGGAAILFNRRDKCEHEHDAGS